MKLSNVANIRLDNSLVEGRGRHFVSRFIEPGLVSYDKAGVLKVSKETLDKFVQSLVGCPVIIRHQKVSNDNVEDLRCGEKLYYQEHTYDIYEDSLLLTQIFKNDYRTVKVIVNTDEAFYQEEKKDA